MKRIAFLFALLAFAGLAAAPVHAGCTVASLRGTYSYMASGISATDGFCAYSGLVTFDGAGNATTHGVVSCAGQSNDTSDSGTYTLDSDCTGVIKAASNGATYYLSLYNNRRAFHIIATSNGVTLAGVGEK